MATEVAVRVKVGVKVGDRDRVSLLLLSLPLAAQSLHARVAAVVARRRDTRPPPSHWPPRDRPLRLLPSPSNFPLKPLKSNPSAFAGDGVDHPAAEDAHRGWFLNGAAMTRWTAGAPTRTVALGGTPPGPWLRGTTRRAQPRARKLASRAWRATRHAARTHIGRHVVETDRIPAGGLYSRIDAPRPPLRWQVL